MDIHLLLLLVAVILAAVASLIPQAGPIHLGWLAVAFLAAGHIV